MPSVLWTLFAVFAPISLVTVGGGQATIAEIQRQVVDIHHWMSQAQFLSDFAIARTAPGPGSLLVTLIGWQVAGFWGALIATIAMFLPTTILLYTVAYLWRRHRGARWQVALEGGLRPIAAGMMAAAVYVLLQSLDGGWAARAVALIATLVVMFTRLNAMVLVLGGSALMIALSLLGLA